MLAPTFIANRPGGLYSFATVSFFTGLYMPPHRDPQATRLHILKISARQMLERGYEAASLSTILEQAEVSKGALYHHFKSKRELGYAVFDEVFIPDFLSVWEEPLKKEDPIEGLEQWLTEFALSVTEKELLTGCPVSKLAMEMSAVDEGFRQRVNTMFTQLGERFAGALAEAQEKNYVKAEVDTLSTGVFIVASIQGLMLQGKYAGNSQVFKSGAKCLTDYIISLRP